MIDYECTNPQRRRIEAHQEANAEIWESDEWKAAKISFLRNNPYCRICHDPSEVPHHPDIEVYGKPEYLNLSGTLPYCNICHDGEHKGKYVCPVCGKIRSKREGDKCYTCLGEGDRECIQHKKQRRNEAKNKRNRENYRKYHPGKAVVNGKWTVIKE